MRNVRVDSEGEFRCWNCGNKGLLAKRTFRSKMLVGVGALLTKKKLKCQTCGEYNDTGDAEPFTGPAARKWRKVYEREQATKGAAALEAERRSAETAAALVVAQIAEANAPAAMSPIAPLPVETPRPPSSPPPETPAAWLADPAERHQFRWWDGAQFTDQVADDGVPGADPIPYGAQLDDD